MLYLTGLIDILQRIEAEHGDLPCYVYSTETKRPMAMIPACVKVESSTVVRPVFGVRGATDYLSISAILPWLQDQLLAQPGGEGE